MAFGTRVGIEPIRTVAFGAISGTYIPLGTPLTNHIRLIVVTSSLNANIYLTTDGITDEIVIGANSYRVLDFSANKVRDDGLFVSSGTQISIKQVSGAPTSGDIWLEAFYGEGGK